MRALSSFVDFLGLLLGIGRSWLGFVRAILMLILCVPFTQGLGGLEGKLPSVCSGVGGMDRNTPNHTFSALRQLGR